MNATPDPLIGRTLDGRYVVTQLLAHGGMGTVYIAHDQRLDRDVAIKVLRADLARDPSFVARFHREARAAARLSHPNVVSVHDQGEDAGVVFLTMELVRGQTLRRLIHSGIGTVADVTKIADQMLDGIGAAHAAGLIHRDIKPENVIVTPHGDVKVTDFGLARTMSEVGVTADSDVLLGTASYLSPEQVHKGNPDTRSDTYAAGLVIYEMLAGTRAFDGDSPIQVAYQHVHDDMPKLADVDAVLEPFDVVLQRASAKDPDDRPAKISELRTELRELTSSLDADLLAHRAPFASPHRNTSDAGAHSQVVTGPDATTHVGDADAPRAGSSAVRPAENHTSAIVPSHTSVMPQEAPPQARRRMMRKWPLAAVIVAVLLAAAALWAWLLGPLAPVTVPNVAGQTEGRAISAIRDAGLDVTVKQANSDSVPAGSAIGTDPKAGDSQRPTSSITLTVSSGPRMVKMPKVTGMSQGQATEALRKTGLSVGSVQHQSSTVKKGLVASTSATAGSSVRHDARINLVISDGPKESKLPDLVDRSEDEAKSELAKLGVKVKVERDNDPEVPKDNVISMSPGKGSKVHSGDEVTLKVSDGPKMTAVPDVVGMNASGAKKALKDAGFKVDGVEFMDELLNHKVKSQSPSAGEAAPEKSHVSVDF